VIGANGLVNASAAVEGWAESTALSATVSRLRYDGFRTDPSEDAPSGATYGDADRWTFNGQTVTDAAGGALRVTLNAVDLDAENPGSLPRDALSDDDRPAWGFNVAQGTGKEIRQGQLGGVWDGPVLGGRGELAAWGIVRDVLNPIPPTVIDLSRRAGGVRALWGSESGVDGAEGTRAEGPRADAAGVPFTWGAGAEVELQRDDRKNFDNESGQKGALTLDQLERVLTTGGFVRAAARPHPRVRVTSALRWDRFRFEADDRYTTDGDDSGSRTMDAWSPTLGLVVRAGPAEVWGNLSTAIETPTTTELVNRPDGGGGFNPRLDPQRSTGAEVGARGRLADDRVRWELAIFRADLEDELVAFESEGGRTFFRNTGASRHEGLEAALEVTLGGGVVARAVYSRTDARFETYELGGEDLSGNRVPGLAPNRLDLRVGQERARFFWSLEGGWTDEVPVDDANSEVADAYFLVDARAGLRELRVADAVVSPWAGVRNALDERYTASVTVNAVGGRYYEPGPGRTAYVGLAVRWDPR
jgi:iron complex outermembrane receptor protein